MGEASTPIFASPFLPQFRAAGNPPGMGVTKREGSCEGIGQDSGRGGRRSSHPLGAFLCDFRLLSLHSSLCRGVGALDTARSRWWCFLEDQLYLILSDCRCCFYIKTSTGLSDGIEGRWVSMSKLNMEHQRNDQLAEVPL